VPAGRETFVYTSRWGCRRPSPGADFASDDIASGTPTFEVKSAGRGVSGTSFHQYGGLAGSQVVAQRPRLEGRAAIIGGKRIPHCRPRAFGLR